jgi:hypothetical protein
MPEYKSREYCRDVKCYNQLEYDNGSISKNILKIYCQDCKAYKFHQWLQENNYKIIKEEKMQINLDDLIDDIREVLQTSSSDLTLPPGKEHEPTARALKELSRVEDFIENILDEHLEMDKEFEGIAEMIEYRPENAPREVLNELLDDIKDIADNNYGKWRNVNE